jgi:hemerythrin-like domain-containing protein
MTDTLTPRTAPATRTGQPTFTTKYHWIHRAQRTSADRLQTAVSGLYPGERTRATALARWTHGFVTELSGHHEVEDLIFLPALAGRVPDHAIHDERLTADHERLDQVLDQLAVMVDELADPHAAFAPAHSHAVALATELRDHLHAHLDYEDRHILPLFEQHFTREEYETIDERAVDHLPRRTMAFTVPWLVDTLSDHERQEIWPMTPLSLRALWHLTRRAYTRRTEVAFGPRSPVVL